MIPTVPGARDPLSEAGPRLCYTRRSMRSVLALLLLLSATAAAAAPSRVLLLRRAIWSAEEAALLEALRIYTRDLGCAIVTEAAPPERLDERHLDRAGARGRQAGADVVAWFAEAEELRLFALRLPSGDLQSTPVTPRRDLEVAAPTLALKLRAFLTREAPLADGPVEEARAEAAPAPRAPPRRAEGPGPAAPPGAALVTRPAPAGRRRAVQLELGLGYGLDLPTDVTWLRHGLVLRAGLALGRVPIAVLIDGALSTQPAVDVASYRVTINDVPIGVTVSARWVRSRVLLSAGPRASLHVLSAAAEGAGARGGQALRYAAGLGASAEVRYRVLPFLSLALSVLAEGTTPRQRFTVEGVEAADLGPFRFGASLGAMFQVL